MTVELMEESSGNLLGFKLSGKITDEDYKTSITPTIEAALESGEPVRMLVYLDESYAGLEAGAMWDDAKFGLAHLGDVVHGRFKRIALVGGPRWQRRVGEIFGHLMPGEIKGFESSQVGEAWSWVKE